MERLFPRARDEEAVALDGDVRKQRGVHGEGVSFHLLPEVHGPHLVALIRSRREVNLCRELFPTQP